MTCPERTYPLPPPDGETDRRFTHGLVLAVAAVLTEHGYPPVTGGLDLVELEQSLFGFLYVGEER